MASVNLTPFSHLTDDELVREVCAKQEVTDLELELMHRLEYLQSYTDTLREQLGIKLHTPSIEGHPV